MKKLIRSISALLALILCGAFILSSCEEITLVQDDTASEKNDEVSTEYNGEEVKYDTSSTGKGEKISMAAVNAEIGSMKASDFEASDGVSDYVLIKVKSYGDIVIVLREDVAPISVANFKKLVKSGFYTNTIFHRVIEGFMIQGGGYVVKDGKWMQSETDSIKGEFAVNGVTNNLLHVRGVISMARTYVPDSATSQFFIMHDAAEHLDGQYAAFGYVLAGMDVVDAIATCEVEGDSNAPSPVETVVIASVTFVKPK